MGYIGREAATKAYAERTAMAHWETNSIVVGVDGSEHAEHAVAVAADIARGSGASVAFVTVVRPPEGWWGIVGSPPEMTMRSNPRSRILSM